MRKSPPPRILPGSINQLFRYGLDILLPNACPLCAEHVAARGLCSDCWRGLTSKKRLQNVSGVFLLKHDSLDALNGKNILLIDDVLTTVATMESCARLLMTRGKAASVSALVLLRVM
uniref:Predicted amidophosphoribosyltransferases n=1 Tax=uncultured alpha proteobacterium EB000_37G09 TaxID=710792 RepID=E0XZG1_9PROT|nr:predicted amidophosphoribosyltransferases [uncultured alpha proteobacterium EB000_37G09]